MNVLALGLLILSLVTSGVLSPAREKRNSGEDVIVKEGHRVVVVEYRKDDGNTKISISPHDSHAIYGRQVDHEKLSETVENSKEKSMPHRGFSPKELVCDAYGKCKHKVESTMGKVKEVVVEKVHATGDMAYEVEEEAREAAAEVVGKVKDMASDASQWTSDKTRGIEERAKDAAYKVYDKATVKLGEKAGEMEGGVREEALEMVENTSKTAKKGAYGVKEEEKKELSDIIRWTREVAFDILEYALPPLSMVFVELHLLAFAAAYGTCLWVTFASSYVLATALPSHQFGVVQGKIYQVYFKAMAYSVGMAFVGHFMSSQTYRTVSRNNTGIGIFQAFNLMMSVVMILVSLLYFQPRAAKVMLGRMEEEKEEGRGKGEQTTAGEKAAAKTEIYSAFLNFMILLSLTCHLLYLGRRLHTSC